LTRDGSHSNSNLTAEYRAFRLADELLEFDHYARNNWRSFGNQTTAETSSMGRLLPDILYVKVESAKQLTARLSPCLEASLSVEKRSRLTSRVQDGVATAFDLFRREFASDRMSGIEGLKRSSVDPEWDVDFDLLADSPFRSPEWRAMWTSVFQFVHWLPRRVRRCFRLSQFLCLECLYERKTQRIASGGDDPRDRISKYVAPLLMMKIHRLQEDIPQLAAVASDLSFVAFGNDESPAARFGYRHWFFDRLDTLHQMVTNRLLEASDDRPKKSTMKPRWDDVAGELWFGDKSLKIFPQRAKNQRRVLCEFEGMDWSSVIEDPLLPRNADASRRKQRLKDTIKHLNAGLARATKKRSPIKFTATRNLTAVSWSVRETP
jgi:hypothetical protein